VRILRVVGVAVALVVRSVGPAGTARDTILWQPLFGSGLSGAAQGDAPSTETKNVTSPRNVRPSGTRYLPTATPLVTTRTVIARDRTSWLATRGSVVRRRLFEVPTRGGTVATRGFFVATRVLFAATPSLVAPSSVFFVATPVFFRPSRMTKAATRGFFSPSHLFVVAMAVFFASPPSSMVPT
jgi:hypothetical protein